MIRHGSAEFSSVSQRSRRVTRSPRDRAMRVIAAGAAQLAQGGRGGEDLERGTRRRGAGRSARCRGGARTRPAWRRTATPGRAGARSRRGPVRRPSGGEDEQSGGAGLYASHHTCLINGPLQGRITTTGGLGRDFGCRCSCSGMATRSRSGMCEWNGHGGRDMIADLCATSTTRFEDCPDASDSVTRCPDSSVHGPRMGWRTARPVEVSVTWN